jgi:hypothetical protein
MNSQTEFQANRGSSIGALWRRCRDFATWAVLGVLFLVSLPMPARAQWLTQNVLVQPGWTAIYLHVDASYQPLDQLVGGDPHNPISEIWLWQPAPSAQFVTSPQNPSTATSQWRNWGRLGLGVTSTLIALAPNAAYLVHSTATTNYTWRVQGQPVAPEYTWTTAGLNFLDFPTVATSPPNYDTFLALAPALQAAAEIYLYPGGDLGPTNPTRLFAYHTTPVTRGQAAWIRSGTLFNSYFGPFQVVVSSSGGADFGATASQVSFRLRNTTPTNVAVTLRLAASESPPPGQLPIVGVPPLLLRGALNPTNLTYGFIPLPTGTPQTWSLPPAGQNGSDIEVVLGLNRYAIPSNPGTLYAGILQFTDSFGFTEVDVPVSAQAASSAGLWVGSADVTQVRNYLKNYQLDTNNSPVLSSNGQYVVTSINTNLGGVARPFPLRLIVHNNGTNVVLLQRVYYGLNPFTNLVVATSESALDPAHLDSARRISATHLPWSAANTPWPFSGQLVQGGTLTAAPDLAYDDQVSNPFLHTYHPDHDNLDTTFHTQLAQGYESYRITRQITLQISPPGNDFTSLTSAGLSVSGNYLETIVLAGLGGATRNFSVSGVFSLNRISPIALLTRP